ncbi:MAG: MFS transporter, partial [Asgard group archaeon]|nr:MFS transporter [Asgard group archaeon]
MNEQKFPYGKSFLLCLGFFTINISWSVYNVFIPQFLERDFIALLGENFHAINTLVGLVMILDNIIAVLMQPYIGQLSDRTWIPKLGRRLPYAMLGIPLAALFLGLIGNFNATLWLLILLIGGFNISISFYKAPVMSLVPDTLPNEYRSQGSGILNVVGSVASIVGLFVGSYLISLDSNWTFWPLSIIMIICLVILVLTTNEKKDIKIRKSASKTTFFEAFRSLLKEKNWLLIINLIGIFFHAAGYQIAETFVSRYVTNILDIPASRAGYILGGFFIFNILMAIPVGFVGRLIGPLNACVIGLAGVSISLIPMIIISLVSIDTITKILTLTPGWELPFVLILIIILGFSFLLVTINSIVVIWDQAPEEKNATYTSYFHVFANLAAIASPFLFGAVFDLYEVITGINGLYIFFVCIGFCYVISFLIYLVVKTKRTQRLMETKDREEYIRQMIQKREYPLLFLPYLLFGVGLRREKAIQDLKQEQMQEILDLKAQYRRLRHKHNRLKIGLDESLDQILELQKKEIEEYKKIEKEK